MGSITPNLKESGYAVIAEFPPIDAETADEVRNIEEYEDRTKKTDKIKNFLILADGHSDVDARRDLKSIVHMILLCGAKGIRIAGTLHNPDENYVAYAITFNVINPETFFSHLASFNRERDLAQAVHNFLEKLEDSYDKFDKLEESFQHCNFMGLEQDPRPADVILTHCSNPRQ
jgi:hypothetical protein